MDKTKVAIGAVAGIGAVAALPVMGSIGSVSFLGAVLGIGLGGAVGMALSGDERGGVFPEPEAEKDFFEKRDEVYKILVEEADNDIDCMTEEEEEKEEEEGWE
jgi:hypothetical protein